jgi:hypothetical protein
VSFATDMITAIESVISGRIPADVEKYQIDGKSIDKIPLNDLLVARDLFRREAQDEQIVTDLAAGKGNPRTIRIRQGGL